MRQNPRYSLKHGRTESISLLKTLKCLYRKRFSQPTYCTSAFLAMERPLSVNESCDAV